MVKDMEIQYEGIWIDGDMIGMGYMITFDQDRNITEVMKCLGGRPVEKVLHKEGHEQEVAPPSSEE